MESVAVKKSPVLAALLAVVGSLLIWGIGHFYAGSTRRALGWLATGLLLWAAMTAFLFIPSQWPGFVAAWALVLGFLAHVADAYIQAGKVKSL